MRLGNEEYVGREQMIPARDRAVWLARHVLPHEPALRGWLAKTGAGGLDVDDVVQETYAVLAGLPTVAHVASPRAYAFQTARSIVLQHLRRSKIVRIEGGDDDLLREAPDHRPDAEAQMSVRQELARVDAVIGALPPKCRECFTLRRVEGLSQRETAQRMGISENTVEKHIGRALRALAAFVYGGSAGLAASQAAEDDGRTP